MKSTEVFIPGKAPTITLVDEHLKIRENALRDALEQGGMLISLSGPSKSGKTKPCCLQYAAWLRPL